MTASAEFFEQTAYQALDADHLISAKENYEKALALNEHFMRAHFGLAQVLQKLGDYPEALIHLQKCMEEVKDQPILFFQMGSCYLQLGQVEKAKNFLEEAVKYTPYHVEALVNLGICFLREKNYSQAIHYFATASRVDEEHGPALFNLACALMEAKRFIQAKDYFYQYLEKAPEDLEAMYHLGFVCLRLEALEEAKKHFQTLLNQSTTHILAMHNLASIAIKQNEPSVALGYYQRILSVAPEDEIAAYMHAALTQKGSPEKAPLNYVKALFDQYAEGFEAHLKEVLDYQTPQRLYDLWPQNPVTVLDLGCGTGLMGELMKPHAKKMIGVDLSSEMLSIARNKNIYDALIESDLLNFLEKNDEVFDLAILADVLVYFGDLRKIFKLLKKNAKSILFSIETGATEPYALTSTGRYRHNKETLLRLLHEQHFQKISHQCVILRTQNNTPVQGEVFFAISD